MTAQNESSPRLGASFRDPSGFLFKRDGSLYRQVNQVYQPHYDLLMTGGLYERLVKAGQLIAHQEVTVTPACPEHAYRVISPEQVEFISYPYEWSFSQLKDAALATLSVQKKAIEAGMVLKDASAYNIQFHRGRPLLIDTLSFEIYQEGEPWVAYRQFCQHFLAPLALMSLVDVRLGQLLRNYIDGVPLGLAARLLPQRTRFNLGLAMHIHLHAAAQKRYAGRAEKPQPARKMSRMEFLGFMDSLRGVIRKLTWKPAGTEWGDYYDASAGHYTEAAFDAKHQVVKEYLEYIQPRQVWDLGANTGEFSRLAAGQGIPTVAFDIDPVAVERNYQAVVKQKESHMLPLLMDFTNPSPSLGWHNRERDGLFERAPADALLALALIHHLAIANNVRLPQLAEFFHSLGHWLVIEFVPKQDSQVQILLASRKDIFPDYHVAGFEAAFAQAFNIHQKRTLPDTERVLYLMEAR